MQNALEVTHRRVGGEGGAPADCNGKGCRRGRKQRKAEKVVADLGGEDRFEL